jgi:hypothetical protein
MDSDGFMLVIIAIYAGIISGVLKAKEADLQSPKTTRPGKKMPSPLRRAWRT